MIPRPDTYHCVLILAGGIVSSRYSYALQCAAHFRGWWSWSSGFTALLGAGCSNVPLGHIGAPDTRLQRHPVQSRASSCCCLAWTQAQEHCLSPAAPGSLANAHLVSLCHGGYERFQASETRLTCFSVEFKEQLTTQ